MKVLLLVFLLLLVLVNGLFVAAEFALVRSRRSRLEALAEEGTRGAQQALGQIDRIDEYLSACQVGITMASIGIGFIAEQTARRLAGFLAAFRAFSGPFTTALTKLSNAIVRLFGVRPGELEVQHTEEDVKAIIHQSATGGSLDPGEAVMLGGVFHLHEQEAREVMTPITAVVTVNAGETVADALQRCVSSGHTRLIVIEDDNPDRVHGIDHNNSLARLYMNAGPDTPIEPAIRDVPIFPVTKPLDDLLTELQRQLSALAVVSDE